MESDLLLCISPSAGFMGEQLWEEAKNDMMVENINKGINKAPKIFVYKAFGSLKPKKKTDEKQNVL